MEFREEYTKNAIRDLKQIPKQTAQQIYKKVKHYIQSNNPLKFAKRLQSNCPNIYRFRIGKYRVIFQINQKGEITIISILEIKHRKEVYKS